MKILDRYVIKNFLIGYVIAFCILLGLRIIIEMFAKLDEFTEHADLGTLAVLANIVRFYGLHTTLYFRDFAGMITVVAAAFSLVKMVRSNELVAIMASGVSLKRVICPIIILSLATTALFVVDQEFIIPPIADKLVMGEDALPGQESYDVWFITDVNGSLIVSQRFDVEDSVLHNPTILKRVKTNKLGVWDVVGRIDAEAARYNHQNVGRWDFVSRDPDSDPNNPRWVLSPARETLKGSDQPPRQVEFYTSDITARDIPVRRKSKHISLLSSRQLSILVNQRTKIRDLAQLVSQKQFRITEPIINMIMILVSLPILVCRDPKTMKSAIMISFAMSGALLVTNFACKMLATEMMFGVRPELWAWIPIFIFAPIAVMMLDSMKT